MCFCMGACSQGQWLADLIEREVAPEGDVAAVIAAVHVLACLLGEGSAITPPDTSLDALPVGESAVCTTA